MSKRLVSILFSGFIFALCLWGNQGDTQDARKIVEKMDELYRAKSSYGVMEMEIVTPHWKRVLKIKSWSEGLKKTFMRILEPKKERGMATLRLDNEMWNFLPKVNKVMKIPPSMMMSSWMGSDFTNDDLVKEFTFQEDYHFEFWRPKKPEEGLIYLKCIPKEGLPIVWGHIIIAVREADHIPVFQKYYDEKGKPMREMIFKDIKTFGDRKIPAVMELIPLNKKGHKTVVRYLEAQFNLKLDKQTFGMRNLRSRI